MVHHIKTNFTCVKTFNLTNLFFFIRYIYIYLLIFHMSMFATIIFLSSMWEFWCWLLTGSLYQWSSLVGDIIFNWLFIWQCLLLDVSLQNVVFITPHLWMTYVVPRRYSLTLSWWVMLVCWWICIEGTFLQDISRSEAFTSDLVENLR